MAIKSNNKKSSRKSAPSARQAGASIALATVTTFSCVHSYAAPFDIAQVPLYLGGTLEPNVMFILDDSGSMGRDYMPDDVAGGWTTRKRNSPDINQIHYNPAVEYLPPVDQDNVSLGNSAYTKAKHNGYSSSSGTTDLTGASIWRYNSGCGNTNNNACYTQVPITSTTAPTGVDGFTNYANWYSYYRLRTYLAKAGVSRAFGALGDGLRVGYGRINKGSSSIDGVNTGTIERGVRKFNGADRQAFFSWLFDAPASGWTPLRQALDDAGQYYSRTDDRGPWSTTPGFTSGNMLSCRQNYTILMTDGYWNQDAANTAAARRDVDGTAGEIIENPEDPASPYTYSPISPYIDRTANNGSIDGQSNTLADVAMYYWKNDLIKGSSGVAVNNVPTNTNDPAFWQHMVTFGIGLGVTGQIDPVTAFDAADRAMDADPSNNVTINWPVVVADTSTTVDDLLHAAVNGHGEFHSAQDPVAFATALAATLESIGKRGSSAAAVSSNVARIDSDSLVFQATFNSDGWTGDIYAYTLNPLTGAPSTSALWSASAGIPTATSRNIATWSGTSGITYQWASLTADQRTTLRTAAPSGLSITRAQWAQRLLNWTRGDQADEAPQGTDPALFRTRTSRLGDIVNSDPAVALPADYGYASAGSLSDAERKSYATRKASSSHQNRKTLLYVGSNDGFLHAFDATYSTSSPSSNGELKEVFAYLPNNVIQHLPGLAARTDFSHRFLNDGAPSVADALVSGSWKTVVVGSTGAGGTAYFAIDAESPTSLGPNKVLWEFAHSELGAAIGQAAIVRTENGKWVAIFGNGYNSASQTAQLFVVDIATGALLKRIDTAVGSAATPNGLATPVAVDTDNNGSADLVYAGDYQGNLWKFDFTATSGTTPWSVAFGGKPLFQAKYGTTAQPITVKPSVGRHPDGGNLVYFGTGKLFQTGDNADESEQSFYGIRDECGAANSGSGCGSISGSAKVSKSNLLRQTITSEFYSKAFTDPDNASNTGVYDVRIFSQNQASATQKGFYIDLISPVNGSEGERVLSSALLWDDRIIFVTSIPNDDPCGFGGSSWLIELDPYSGARTDFSVFDLNNDSDFNSQEYIDGKAVNGRRFKDGMIKRPGVVRSKDGTKGYKYTSDSSGSLTKTDNPLLGSFGRQSWRQLR